MIGVLVANVLYYSDRLYETGRPMVLGFSKESDPFDHVKAHFIDKPDRISMMNVDVISGPS